MGMFLHPHLTRGIVKTAKGAFVVSRGLVEMPDELGESLGWLPADAADDTPATTHSLQAQESQQMTGAHMMAAQRRRERA